VPEVETDMGAASPRGLPGASLFALAPPGGSAAQLSTLWMAWRDAALDEQVPLADLESRFTAHLAAATDEKTKDDDRPRHLYMAGRVLQELEARIHREVALRACARAAEVLTGLADARDDALRATLRLERGLQGELRTQLEDTRLQAETRQEQVFSALRQLEGEFARITQEARGTIVSLSDILFDFDRATLKRQVEFNLVRVATILNQFPEMGVGVEGHTDNVGTAEYNLDLSERRAAAVRDFLATQGVAAERMTAAGFGVSRPVADNGTAEGRQRNRRVDLVIQEAR
jgi:outer membrane protein OmpA-like peptidoglycan-associated protein